MNKENKEKRYEGKILPGKPYPLGAIWDSEGVTLPIYSEKAERVEVCLFDALNPKSQRECIPLGQVTGHVCTAICQGEVPDSYTVIVFMVHINRKRDSGSILPNC